MKFAKVNGVELEYEVIGSGQPVLLISPVLADGFLPLVAEPSLNEHYQLIRYHKRGWVGSTHPSTPVTVADHAADAAALLDRLGIACAHVVGHSSGAAVAAQLALEEPELVGTLALLELSIFSVPSGQSFLEAAAPVLEAYNSGDHEGALSMFLSAVSGLDWATCSALLDERVPGAVPQAIKDADTFFGSYLPALNAWQFGPEQAAAISQPVLSVLGTESEQWFVDSGELLHSWFPQVEDCTIEGAAHLLQMQCPQPVARGVAEFFARHPITHA
jgi:pimeloyl-ACP methyl ester carboxylesterase